MENDLTNQLNEPLLTEFLDNMSKINHGALVFTLQPYEDTWVLGTSSNINPMAFSEPLKSFLIYTNQKHLENPNEELHVQDYVLNSLVKAIMGYLDEMKFMDKKLKYDRFSKGDLNGLSSDEMDEFLDIKLQEIKHKKDNLIPLVYRYRPISKSSILYSPDYDLILSLAHDLQLTNFRVSKLKTKLDGFSEFEETYSLLFNTPYNWGMMIEAYKQLDLDGVKLINYETREVYSKYISD